MQAVQNNVEIAPVPSPKNKAPRFGAAMRPGGETCFRIWAPGVERIWLEVEGGERRAMPALDEQWFELTIRPESRRYRFRLPDGTRVPDPASRAQDGDVHGWSLLVDPSSYVWRTQGWRGRPWVETVIYELHVGLLGGFTGVEATLEDLARLGVTAIELMPIADFPGVRNWGYDGVLPYAPDESYGTPDELKQLIDRAHGLGISVFLDVVYNHFGPDGSYISVYAPAAFRDDIQTPWGAAIDFDNPLVREFFTHNAIYWLDEFRFDGLRFDAVHEIGSEDFLDEIAAATRASVEPGRHVHLIVENENNEAHLIDGLYDAQWNDDFHHCLHVLLTGETAAYYQSFRDEPAEKLARALSEGFVYQGQLNPHRGAPRGSPSGHLPPTGFVNFLQNHDQTGNRAFGERLVGLCDAQALRLAVALLLLTPAIPMLFMGEETGSRSPFLFFTDYHDELAEAVREGRRSEFAGFPAFADSESRLAIPDPNDPETFLRSVPVADPDDAGDWFAVYQELLAIRREHLVPRLDGAASLFAQALSPMAVAAAWTLGDGSTLTILANFGRDAAATVMPAGAPLHQIGATLAADLVAGSLPPLSYAAYLAPPDASPSAA